jgi:hypothetical protein
MARRKTLRRRKPAPAVGDTAEPDENDRALRMACIMRSVSCGRGVLSPGFSLSIWVAAGLRLKPELRTPGFILSGRRNATWIISVEEDGESFQFILCRGIRQAEGDDNIIADDCSAGTWPWIGAGSDFGREAVGADHGIVVRPDHQPMHFVGQLPHVARPVVSEAKF